MKILNRISRSLHLLAGVVRKLCFLFPNDKIYLKIIYRLEMGHKLNLDMPHSFTEKIQWLKLYDRKPEYTKMVDKIAAKEYVADIIGNEYIIPTLGVWESFDDIDFSQLPNQFVLKCNQGGGGSGIIICRDKSKLDKEKAKKELEHSMRTNCYPKYREWPYKNIVPKIFAEQLLFDSSSISTNGKMDLTDYKWYCFDGEPKYCQVIQDRHTHETIDFFDTEWNHQEFIGLNPAASHAVSLPKCPKSLETQIDIARKLSKGMPFSRIDLYEVDNHVYFGEITFYPASGFGSFKPEIYNEILGKMMKLPEGKRR